MRSIATCYSDRAVTISDSYCSGASSRPFIPPQPSPATPFAVSCVYKVKNSDDKLYFVTITWCASQRAAISIRDASDECELLYHLTRKEGNKTLHSPHQSVHVDVLWDLSNACYEHDSLEPVNGFYILVVIDSELALVIGSSDEAAKLKDLKARYPPAKYSDLISRNEYFSGSTIYSTKAQFFSSGLAHEITIKCLGEEYGSSKSPVLSVSVDSKRIFQVRRLKWNFRGNQTIYLDGLMIDMMWDLHDWFFKVRSSSGSGYRGRGVFMFRTRNGIESSRLWMDDKNLMTSHDKGHEFSLLICAFL